MAMRRKRFIHGLPVGASFVQESSVYVDAGVSGGTTDILYSAATDSSPQSNRDFLDTTYFYGTSVTPTLLDFRNLIKGYIDYSAIPSSNRLLQLATNYKFMRCAGITHVFERINPVEISSVGTGAGAIVSMTGKSPEATVGVLICYNRLPRSELQSVNYIGTYADPTTAAPIDLGRMDWMVARTRQLGQAMRQLRIGASCKFFDPQHFGLAYADTSGLRPSARVGKFSTYSAPGIKIPFPWYHIDTIMSTGTPDTTLECTYCGRDEYAIVFPAVSFDDLATTAVSALTRRAVGQIRIRRFQKYEFAYPQVRMLYVPTLVPKSGRPGGWTPGVAAIGDLTEVDAGYWQIPCPKTIDEAHPGATGGEPEVPP